MPPLLETTPNDTITFLLGAEAEINLGKSLDPLGKEVTATLELSDWFLNSTERAVLYHNRHTLYTYFSLDLEDSGDLLLKADLLSIGNEIKDAKIRATVVLAPVGEPEVRREYDIQFLLLENDQLLARAMEQAEHDKGVFRNRTNYTSEAAMENKTRSPALQASNTTLDAS